MAEIRSMRARRLRRQLEGFAEVFSQASALGVEIPASTFKSLMMTCSDLADLCAELEDEKIGA